MDEFKRYERWYASTKLDCKRIELEGFKRFKELLGDRTDILLADGYQKALEKDVAFWEGQVDKYETE